MVQQCKELCLVVLEVAMKEVRCRSVGNYLNIRAVHLLLEPELENSGRQNYEK